MEVRVVRQFQLEEKGLSTLEHSAHRHWVKVAMGAHVWASTVDVRLEDLVQKMCKG
jgi:hypothetical protein